MPNFIKSFEPAIFLIKFLLHFIFPKYTETKIPSINTAAAAFIKYDDGSDGIYIWVGVLSSATLTLSSKALWSTEHGSNTLKEHSFNGTFV